MVILANLYMKRGKMNVSQHKKEAPKKVKCKVITVSDTRTIETDKSGRRYWKMPYILYKIIKL